MAARARLAQEGNVGRALEHRPERILRKLDAHGSGSENGPQPDSRIEQSQFSGGAARCKVVSPTSHAGHCDQKDDSDRRKHREHFEHCEAASHELRMGEIEERLYPKYSAAVAFLRVTAARSAGCVTSATYAGLCAGWAVRRRSNDPGNTQSRAAIETYTTSASWTVHGTQLAPHAYTLTRRLAGVLVTATSGTVDDIPRRSTDATGRPLHPPRCSGRPCPTSGRGPYLQGFPCRGPSQG